MHILCMASKTISLHLDAYERLRSARRTESESFSSVVMRADWPELGITGAELLAAFATDGPHLSEAALNRVDAAKADDAPPQDKWSTG